MNCQVLNNQKTDLFNSIINIVPSFKNMNLEEKFYVVRQRSDYDIISICVLSISQMYIEREKLLHKT